MAQAMASSKWVLIFFLSIEKEKARLSFGQE
jgi:hypothetical protein